MHLTSQGLPAHCPTPNSWMGSSTLDYPLTKASMIKNALVLELNDFPMNLHNAPPRPLDRKLPCFSKWPSILHLSLQNCCSRTVSPRNSAEAGPQWVNIWFPGYSCKCWVIFPLTRLPWCCRQSGTEIRIEQEQKWGETCRQSIMTCVQFCLWMKKLETSFTGVLRSRWHPLAGKEGPMAW